MADIFSLQPQGPGPNEIVSGAEIKIVESIVGDDNQLIPAESNDKDKQKEIAKAVFEILDEVLDSKVELGLPDKWKRNYELLKGKHWRNTADKKIPLISANYIFLHHQRTVNTLTDNNPTFNVVHVDTEALTEDPENNVYEDLQKCATHWWIDQEQQDVLERSVSNGENYGIAIEKVVFNPDLEMGIGEVETVVVDPYHFGLYPVDITDPREVQKAQVVLHFIPTDLREAQRRYPDADIKADSDVLKDLQDDRREINSPQSTQGRNIFVTVASKVRQIMNYTGGSGTDKKDEVLMVEAWVKDYSKKKRTGTAKQGDTKVEMQETESKYPGDIRYILCCNGDKVLEDKPNPNINMSLPLEQVQKTYLYDKVPFCAVNSIKDAVSFWGSSDIDQLEWLNMELNKALSQLVLDKDRSARKKIINPKDSGVPDTAFTNFQGIISPANSEKSKAIRYLDYPKNEQDITDAIKLFKDMLLQIAGTFEVDQAEARGNDAIAYKAIAALIERAATMQRGKIRSYGRLIRERGRMYLSHVMNFYQEDRWISYQDKDGIPKTKKIDGKQLIVPAKLTVVTGSTLPISKVQQREEALNLFKEKAIDQQALLDTLEWSGRADIIERMAAGPVGMVMNAMKIVGVPDEFLQYFQKVAVLDPKKIEGMMQSRQIPPFQQVLMPVVQHIAQQMGQPIQPPPPDPETQSKIVVNEAQAQRHIAEAGKFSAQQVLATEQTNTEKVKQAVASAGIGFDEEKLNIEKARTVAQIRQDIADTVAEAKKLNADTAQVDVTPAGINPPRPTNPLTSTAHSDLNPFNERGMTSDNQLD